MGESIDDINNRWLSMVHGHWAGPVANDPDAGLMDRADIVIDLSSDDEPLDYLSGGEPVNVLRMDDGSHCAFAIKFDSSGNAAVIDGRVQARMIGANDDELVHLAHGGTVRGISSYSFYPDLKDLAARTNALIAAAGEIGYRPAEPLKTGSVSDLTAGLAALGHFVTAAVENPETVDQAFPMITSLQDLADDLVPARKHETVRTLLLRALGMAAYATPPLVLPKAAAIIKAHITRQAGETSPQGGQGAPVPNL